MRAEGKPIESRESKRVAGVALVGLVIGLVCWLTMVFIQLLLSGNPTPSILIASTEVSITMAGGAIAGTAGTLTGTSRTILRGAISGAIAGSFLTVATYLMMLDIEHILFLFYSPLAFGL